jgi:hypothetical protein
MSFIIANAREVFPEPDSPAMHSICPLGNEKEILLSTGVFPAWL